VGEVIPVGSLRPIRTTQKIWEAAPSNAHHGGGFMPTAETTLNPASGHQSTCSKKIVDERCAIRQRTQFWTRKALVSRNLNARRLEPVADTPEEFGGYVRSEIVR
jgi:hypothetical protein